jgi:DNA polymerase-3 subunit delta
LKKYIKPLGDLAEIKYFRHPDKADADTWIKKEFSKSNKAIKPDALRLLKENAGNDLATLSSEIEKLALYAGTRNIIEKQDVEELVGRSSIQTGFELVNAISSKSPDRALSILRGLFKSDKRAAEILGILAWYLRRLQKGKELIKQNAAQGAISEKLKVPHWLLDDFIRQVKSLSERDINKSLSLLLKCDLNIKTGKVKEEQAVEFLVAELSC